MFTSFILADGIKCYDCRSTEADCAKDKLEADKAKYLKTCFPSYDSCMRFWAKIGNSTYAVVTNTCIRKATCDAAKKSCDDDKDDKDVLKDVQCDASCCATDGCNAVSTGEPSERIIPYFSLV